MTARHMRRAAIVPEGDLLMGGVLGDGLDGIEYEAAQVAVAFTEAEVQALAYLLRAYGIDEITEQLAEMGRPDDGYRAVSTVLAAAADIESKEKEA